MQEVNPPKMPPLPAWDTLTRDTLSTDILIIVISLIIAIYALYRWRTHRQKAAPKSGRERELSASADNSDGLSLLNVGQMITVIFLPYDRQIEAKIINVAPNEFTLVLPPETMDLPLQIGDAVEVILRAGKKSYQIPAIIEKLFTQKLRACTLHHDTILTFNRVTDAVPTTFALLPQNLVVDDYIPLADLYQEIPCELPGNLLEFDHKQAQIITKVALKFTVGDLVAFVLLPKNREAELYLLGTLTAVEKTATPTGNGQLLTIKLLITPPEYATLLEDRQSKNLENFVVT